MTRLESDLVQTGVCEKGGKRSILVVQKRRLTRRPKSNDVLRQHKDYDRWTIFSSIFIIFGKIRFCAEKKKRGDGRRKKSRGARFEENVGRTLGLTFFLSLSLLSSRMRWSKLAFRVPRGGGKFHHRSVTYGRRLSSLISLDSGSSLNNNSIQLMSKKSQKLTCLNKPNDEVSSEL